MKQTYLTFFLSIVVITLFSQLIVSDAHARRFGGGASFGSRPSFNKSFKRAPLKRSLSPAQKQASAKNQTIRKSMGKRGGMMGMFGALAMGGLLGSLFFGGAFENFNMFDILVIGGILYLVFKLMAMRAQRTMSVPYSRNTYDENSFGNTHTGQNQPRAFDTDLMFKKDQAVRDQTITSSDDVLATIELDDFDEAAFLDGAKGAFRMLQSAWDAGNQTEIRRMTTDKVFAEIKRDLENQSTANYTEIMSLNAQVLSARQVDNELQVQVLFDANIHELPESITSNVEELWHFIRPANDHGSMWFLDGIQQVD
ncbi:MAG: Tim44-like domain-containing protein [Methylococcales bacterium]